MANDELRPTKETVDRLCKTLVDQGKLIEAGWKSYDLLVLSPNAPDVQRSETRLAFFAGAQHLFGSIMSILEPGAEPTENDLRRMTAIDLELTQYIEEFKFRTAQPEGSA